MGIQSDFFDLDGNTREFGSTKHIATKRNMAVWLRLVVDSSWVQLTSTAFDLINNFAVLDNAPDNIVYNQIEIRVADTEDELTQSPSDITIVAGIASEVQTVAGISSEVVTVAGDTVAINNINDNLAEILDADVQAANAATSAAAALVSATNAATSETNAGISETNAATSETNAGISEVAAAASAASIDPTNLLHTEGYGGSDPEGYTTAQIDAAVANRRKLYAKEFVTITPDADANYVLTTAENLYGRMNLVDGSWLSGHEIHVDTSVRAFIVDNSAGTYDATVKTLAGTGITVLSGDTAYLYCDGTNVTFSLGLEILKDDGKSLATNGYQKLSNGLILQWGDYDDTLTSKAVTFPIAFPNAVLAITPNTLAPTADTGGTTGTTSVVHDTISLAGFTLSIYSVTSGTGSWFAIGY
jgi:hypothetical protein